MTRSATNPFFEGRTLGKEIELGTLPSMFRTCVHAVGGLQILQLHNALGNFSELPDPLLSSNFNSFANQRVESGVHMASVNQFEDLIQGQAQALILTLMSDWLLANSLLFSASKKERAFSHWPPSWPRIGLTRQVPREPKPKNSGVKNVSWLAKAVEPKFKT
jgi:hypothetical protein